MRSRVWGMVAVAGLALLTGATIVGMSRISRGETSGPLVRPVASAAPVTSWIDGVRHVRFEQAPAALIPDSAAPTVPAVLLWLDGRPAALTATGSVLIDAAGGVLEFDRRLRPRQRRVLGGGREWLSVAGDVGGRLWLTDASGDLFHLDESGSVQAVPRPAFAFTSVATDPTRGTPWLARSRHRFSYGIPPERAPLVIRADRAGSPVATLGLARRPEHVLLSDLANAGSVAIRDSVVFFAPFIRDELVAMSADGAMLWVASRSLPQDTPEPRFELQEGKAVVAYHPVNLGLTVGPDGLLYVLSTDGMTTTRSRLDVFEPATGALLRTASLPTATPSLAVDGSGRLYALDAVAITSGVSLREREPIPAADFRALNGGRIDLASHRGRVLLLNLWASWCTPCREEMPALVSMQGAFEGPEFAFIGMNDDVDEAAAARFLAERGFTFPNALGHGTMKTRFHAPGLPVTILVDREGREVQRWIGYAGPEQLDGIRAAIRAELDRTTTAPMAHHHSD